MDVPCFAAETTQEESLTTFDFIRALGGGVYLLVWSMFLSGLIQLSIWRIKLLAVSVHVVLLLREMCLGWASSSHGQTGTCCKPFPAEDDGFSGGCLDDGFSGYRRQGRSFVDPCLSKKHALSSGLAMMDHWQALLLQPRPRF